MNLSETFDRLGANEIAEFIQLSQEEHLHLDFKTVNSANLRSSDDKRNLAKCLSGFANSSGGIIVWGIDARKNAQGIDCASATVEIAPVRLFVARLNELTGEAASPIVEGVRHKSIAVTRDSGFAATLVPEGDSGPHMAKLGEDRYYKRSGDSFYRMEHFDLEDMFGRRQKPRLSFSIAGLPRMIALFKSCISASEIRVERSLSTPDLLYNYKMSKSHGQVEMFKMSLV
jgi:predicted HTH transcriptional regulator